jgi:hypothetical protein
MHDTRSHQIEAEIADAGRVRDQGDDYRGIEATNPKNSQQKYGGAWDCRCWTHSRHLPLGLLLGSQHELSSEHEAEGKMSSTKKHCLGQICRRQAPQLKRNVKIGVTCGKRGQDEFQAGMKSWAGPAVRKMKSRSTLKRKSSAETGKRNIGSKNWLGETRRADLVAYLIRVAEW